ncbi:MAG: flagellar hook assembly protein FlgD [Bdellovibrionales bacterium]|nr:flagellar hook assembly protein FlgD [Bdellovibrionales bacterium]
MEITRANAGIGVPSSPGADSKDREQALKNSMAQIQARYGEKPKEARVAKKALDKDDFMRIMITEMRHQDPTKPMDSDRMATQMAQITSVEQLKNVSNAIEKMADKNNASDRLAMSGMIGRTVTVDKGRFAHQKGTISPINFELPEDANRIKITILNEQGEEIATRDLEPMKSGMNVYSWDGITASNTQTGSGTYLVRVDAENSKGGKIKVDPISKERIVGVSFEGGDTHFLVGESKAPQKVAFKNVIRIETGSGSPKESPSESAVSSAAEKVSESNADSLPQGLQEKLRAEMAEAVEPEGFPNGLND